MRVAGGVIEKEGLLRFGRNEGFAVISHFHCATPIALDFFLEEINFFGSIVMFAHACGAVSGLCQHHRQCFHPRETAELVVAV